MAKESVGLRVGGSFSHARPKGRKEKDRPRSARKTGGQKENERKVEDRVRLKRSTFPFSFRPPHPSLLAHIFPR